MKKVNNKQGFTLIELLAVIVVLSVVTVLATRSILPFMANARSDSFRTEASNVINSANDAINFYNLGRVTLKDNGESCKVGKTICFTVDELISLGIFEAEEGTFSGKVIVNVTNPSNPTYNLWLQKGAEFSIVNGAHTDYVNNGELISGGFPEANVEEYTTCDCS